MVEEIKVNADGGSNVVAETIVVAEEKVPISWTSCKICKRSFNCKSRVPINIICCGNIACLDCVETKMVKEGSERGKSVKGKFKCAFSDCGKDHCAP
jgi:hypothetical protein